jgi:hypothetical protein
MIANAWHLALAAAKVSLSHPEITPASSATRTTRATSLLLPRRSQVQHSQSAQAINLRAIWTLYPSACLTTITIPTISIQILVRLRGDEKVLWTLVQHNSKAPSHHALSLYPFLATTLRFMDETIFNKCYFGLYDFTFLAHGYADMSSCCSFAKVQRRRRFWKFLSGGCIFWRLYL